MANHLSGSKKRERRAEAERRKSEAFKRRLGSIYELSRQIRNDEELQAVLDTTPDPEVREEIRKLITPFLLFQPGQTAAVASSPEKATIQVVATMAEAARGAEAPRPILITDATRGRF